MKGVDDKDRFSLKYPDGKIESFGTCDPRDDDRMKLQRDGDNFAMLHYPIAGGVVAIPLDKDTLVTNGFYEKEWDGWKTLNEYLD